MPELPDVTIYVERLRAMVSGSVLERVRIGSPFVLRSVEPPIGAAEGRLVEEIGRLGKRIVFHLEDDLHLVIHLMIAGRLKWRDNGKPVPKKLGLAAFDFAQGSLLFTEAGSKKRASLHVVQGRDALSAHDRGGIEILDCTVAEFRQALTSENHTLKRALTDPRLFSGIGNAYSDEILHAAGLSPLQLTSNLSDGEITRLHGETINVMRLWIERLRDEVGTGFPEKVTAFDEKMAVHGRYRQPCPKCGSPVQRIVYAKTEVNYCPRCQTGGRMLADRALSRLLRTDWPKTLDQWEDPSSSS